MPVLAYVAESVASVRSKIIGYGQAAGLRMRNWLAGGIGMQILETVAPTVQEFTAVAAKTARAFGSLDSATDPGDPDAYDPANAGYAPAPGALSDHGRNLYGTERIAAREATGTVTFDNTGTGAVNQTHNAFALTFQRDNANSDGSKPLYRNSTAVSVLAGTVATVPIIAEQPGTASNASAGHVVILVSTLPGVTVTNAAAVVGTDRQDADSYREACREAASLTSPNGPADSYRYLATTGRTDGTYGNSTTGTSLGITKIYVSEDSSTGIVEVYYKGAAGGAAISGSVAMANQILTSTPGVISVPDAITFSGAAATDDTVAVTFTLKVKATSVPGAIAGTYTKTGAAASSPDASADAVFTAIDNALAAYFADVDIGGFDQTAGAGTLYADEIRSKIAAVWPTTYHTTLTAPAGDVSLAKGHTAILGTITRSVTLT